MESGEITIKDMNARHPGLKSPVAECYYVAACVCLDRHHTSPVTVSVEGPRAIAAVRLVWEATDEATRAAWANELDATEAGAYAVVIAAVEMQTGMVAVRRAEARSGADYYIGPLGAGREDLEDCVRLEVSGLDRGTDGALRARLARKLRQASDGASDVPAMAGVFGFLLKRSLIEEVEKAG